MKYITKFAFTFLLISLCNHTLHAMELKKKDEQKSNEPTWPYCNSGLAGKTEYDMFHQNPELITTENVDNPIDTYNTTPLIIATQFNNQAMVTTLLTARANINKATTFDWTAFHAAMEYDHFDLAEYLVRYGALNLPDNRSSRPTDAPFNLARMRQLTAAQRQQIARIKKLIEDRDMPQKPKKSRFRFGCCSSKTS